MQNWWVEMTRDGFKTVVKGGSGRGRKDDFTLTIRQRVCRESVEVLTVKGHADDEGCLRLSVFNEKGEPIHNFFSVR